VGTTLKTRWTARESRFHAYSLASAGEQREARPDASEPHTYAVGVSMIIEARAGVITQD
jgi:hypothetical protein